jgi:hypothetical protein
MTVMSLLRRLYRFCIPAPVRAKVRQADFWNNRRAMWLAGATRRLDLCAAQVAMNFHLAHSFSLEGKVCLEIGSGWVLSHALVFYLLGAKQVIATDIVPLANPAATRHSVRSASPATVRDVLAPYAEHSAVRGRLDELVNADQLNLDTLASLGVHYIAPIDLTRERLDMPVDFIYSNSVLEHVPLNDIPNLLCRLNQALTSGGIMIHCIHLEDHKDYHSRPFAFYSEPETEFPADVSLDRGNRIRSSGWKYLFDEMKDVKTCYLYEWSRKDVNLPEFVHSSVSHQGFADLRVTHIGLLSMKK